MPGADGVRVAGRQSINGPAVRIAMRLVFVVRACMSAFPQGIWSTEPFVVGWDRPHLSCSMFSEGRDGCGFQEFENYWKTTTKSTRIVIEADVI